MSKTTPIVTIFGGSGFVGRYIAHRMARAGWRVRVAVRRPNEAMYVKPYGDVGQVEPILCNIRDEASTRRAIAGADAVVNCVGILQETKFQSFEDVHVDAADLIARLSAEADVSKLIHISALGADADSDSVYSETKAEGDALVLQAMPHAVILRPSVMFGTEDRFFNRMAEFSRLSPVMPVFGADTKFQPVYVNDIAVAVETAITDDIAGGIYELGGPEVASLHDLTKGAMEVAGRRRILLDVPFWSARMTAWSFEMIEKMTGGLVPAMLTRDQIKMLRVDNVVSEGANGFAELGIEPTAMESVLDGYLYHYRAYGQYTAITESGKKPN
ncbi:complex I NDUFA9 subunit family protein [Rhodobacterales bacterium 52_120_T64]|nr:complex I NDUFA9 subunit family protein [Rhodobacterales bacterium 52_120_T64]